MHEADDDQMTVHGFTDGLPTGQEAFTPIDPETSEETPGRWAHITRRMLRLVLVLSTLLIARGSFAEGPTVASDSFPYRPGGRILVDAGLVLGFPTALPTGLSRGVGAGVTLGDCPLRWGARAAWITATEGTQIWTVTHSDLRLRLTGSAQHDAGRGSLGIRLGIGGTLVHETRTRNQGARAGRTGSELETSALAMVPASDLEAVVGLHLLGPWLLTISGGPSFAVVDGSVHSSWTAELGVAWQP